jgi:Reverse transcriptase (RNA-dependent DNA polymerase)
VVSRDSVRIALTIAALNGLKVMACDIQNAYLTANCREKIWTIGGPEFGSEAGTIFIVKKALYGLKSAGAAFRSLLADTLSDLGYKPTKADPDAWLRPAVKADGFMYYEMVLCYVDDILSISDDPERSLLALTSTFKLKDDKIEEPEAYLGAKLDKMTVDGIECWTMSAEQYVNASVKNVEEALAKRGLRLPTKCYTPLPTDYHPELETSAELKSDGIQLYQELVGVLRWAVELGRLDILLEVALMSTHLAMPRQGHLQQVYRIFGYLKIHPKRKIAFDPQHPQISERMFQKHDWHDFYRGVAEAIPGDMPEPRGNPMSTHCFVDASHGSDKASRRSQTGILIFCNKAPIIWFSKKQNTVETSTFGSEFQAMKNAVELIEALRYKLRMFGVPLDGPTNVFCDNEAVYKNTSLPESTLKKKHHAIAYHRCREAVAAETVRVAKEGTQTNLSDLFTKLLPQSRREELLDKFTY